VSDGAGGDQVDGIELLSRFLTKKDWVRKDGTIKQDAFVPPRDLHFSVTRHGTLSETELWRIGQDVADEISRQTNTPYYGRADIKAAAVAQIQPLRTVPFPLPKNPNHAHIDGWPLDKSDQKRIAQELAAQAGKAIPQVTFLARISGC